MVFRCLGVLAFLTVVSISQVRAQSIEPSEINASGISSSVSGNILEYSIGQLIPSGAQAPHTPGVLQPWINTTGIEQQGSPQLSVQVFPDPMESLLFLQPDLPAAGSLQCILFDASGKVILKQEFKMQHGRERQQIDVTPFAAGNYLLEVTSFTTNCTAKASFKLQKIR